MTTSLTTHLPNTVAPYLLRRGEGKRYLFGKQLATVIANFQSTGDILSAAILSGPKGNRSHCIRIRTPMNLFLY